MKKAAIVTITQKSNFGNRLQNYAVQKILEEQGLKVETLINIDNDSTIKYYLKKIKQIVKSIIKVNNPYVKRENAIDRFDKKYIKFSKKIVGNKLKNNINKDYDYFVCGSDQIWNLNYFENGIVNFLGFCDKTKKIALSPSFGSEKYPNNLDEKYIKWILDFKHISCREEAGKEIIKKLTGRTDTVVLVDPTLTLEKKEWDEVESTSKVKDKLNNKKYILLCFLGKLSQKRKKEIEETAKNNNCEIINIFDPKCPFFECGPSEFLSLEKNAFLICTDSYHSCIFSIIYKRPFVIYDREENLINMNSRIESLLTKFELNERKYINKITEKHLICDYSHIDEILNIERKKTIEFIEKSMVREGEESDRK